MSEALALFSAHTVVALASCTDAAELLDVWKNTALCRREKAC
jgi:hypothetical protein